MFRIIFDVAGSQVVVHASRAMLEEFMEQGRSVLRFGGAE